MAFGWADDERTDRADERDAMVDEQIASRGVRDLRVLQALRRVPRHLFLPDPFREEAYQDHPVPIGSGQTISQPYIVALMTEALELRPEDKVLEVGTGSGYQTAILAELARHVCTVERLPELLEEARCRLESLGYRSVSYRIGDGSLGWPDEAPYDAVVVTAAAPDVPAALLEQLAQNGRIVIPTGGEFTQVLECGRKVRGRLVRRVLCDCRFVKLIGEQAWPE